MGVNIQLEGFEIELYENSMPSQYLSHVAYINSKLEQQSTISVNHPLRYEGIKIYQQSYGNGQWRPKAGQVDSSTVLEGQILEVADSKWQVKVFKYVPDFDLPMV